MSFENLYEYIPSEFQDISRKEQEPAGSVSVWFRDENGVKLGGYNIELWDAPTAGTQLTEGVDYTLDRLDTTKTALEGFDIWGGYSVLNPVYQAVPIYLTARIIGGYTDRRYRPIYEEVTANATVVAGERDTSVFVDTSGGDVDLTIDDAERKNDRVTVYSSGGGNTNVTGTGITQIVNQQGLAFVWDGSGWLPAGGTGGGGAGLDIGMVIWKAEKVATPGTLYCDGLVYLIADYPQLFAQIGTKYGGDGVTTFGVPDFRGIGAIGAGQQTGPSGQLWDGDDTDSKGLQEDQLHGHWHQHYSNSSTVTVSGGGSNLGFNVPSGWTLAANDANGNPLVREAVDDGVNGTPRTGEYTRGASLAGYWYIVAEVVESGGGTPLDFQKLDLIDTTAGDVAAVPPASPAQGFQWIISNTGAGGNYVTDIPGFIRLGDGKTIRLTRMGPDWKYEDVIIEESQITSEQLLIRWAGGRQTLIDTWATDNNPRDITAAGFVSVNLPTVSAEANVSGAAVVHVLNGAYTTASYTAQAFISNSGAPVAGTNIVVTIEGRWKTGI